MEKMGVSMHGEPTRRKQYTRIIRCHIILLSLNISENY